MKNAPLVLMGLGFAWTPNFHERDTLPASRQAMGVRLAAPIQFRLEVLHVVQQPAEQLSAGAQARS